MNNLDRAKGDVNVPGIRELDLATCERISGGCRTVLVKYPNGKSVLVLLRCKPVRIGICR